MDSYRVTFVSPTSGSVNTETIPATSEEDARRPYEGIRIIDVEKETPAEQ